MALDPDYVERVVSKMGPVDSRPEAERIDSRGAIWFLLGRGLTPQEVYDVLRAWWFEGFRNAKHGGTGTGSDL